MQDLQVVADRGLGQVECLVEVADAGLAGSTPARSSRASFTNSSERIPGMAGRLAQPTCGGLAALGRGLYLSPVRP